MRSMGPGKQVLVAQLSSERRRGSLWRGTRYSRAGIRVGALLLHFLCARPCVLCHAQCVWADVAGVFGRSLGVVVWWFPLAYVGS